VSYYCAPYVNPDKRADEDANDLIAELWPNGVEESPPSPVVLRTIDAEESEWSRAVEIIEAAETRGLRAPEWAYAVVKSP
jgi:hypothetical protein